MKELTNTYKNPVLLFLTVCTCIIYPYSTISALCTPDSRSAEELRPISRKLSTQAEQFFPSQICCTSFLEMRPLIFRFRRQHVVTAQLWSHLCLSSWACAMTTAHFAANCERRDKANFAVIDWSHLFLSEQDIDTTSGITQRSHLLLLAICLDSSARKRVDDLCSTLTSDWHISLSLFHFQKSTWG